MPTYTPEQSAAGGRNAHRPLDYAIEPYYYNSGVLRPDAKIRVWTPRCPEGRWATSGDRARLKADKRWPELRDIDINP
jgi:hypothetical protein